MSLAFDSAKALHVAGRLEEAADAYRRLPEGDPDRHRALNNLGLILEGWGRLTEAAETFDQAVAARADVAALHCNRARALHRLGRLQEAVAGYRRAIELEPDWVDPHHNLAMAQEEAGEPEAAEPAFRRTLDLEPQNRAAQRHLADILFDSGRPAAALPHYRAVVTLSQGDPRAHFDLAKTLTAIGSDDEALASYRRSLEIEPRSGPTRQNLVSALRRLGRQAEARDVLERWIELAPDDQVPRHMLSALTGEAVPARAADETVRNLFDELAGSFDATLARLDYRAPELVGEALAACRPGDRPVGDVLDAGCGTGLCGALLRPRASRLVGVDLSAGMIGQARRLGLYDELVEAELTGFLEAHPAAFDLIASSDTLNYFGALEEVLGAAARALRPGGHLVFTLERETGAGQPPWHLQPNGRYGHSETYLRAAIDAAGLGLAALRTDVLRKEGAEPVAGWILTATRPD